MIHEFQKQTPNHFPKEAYTFRLVGLNDDFVKQLGGTLALLFSAVALLLAIGCGNVSILLLARGAARQHELALRTAVGATRNRIVRQLLTDVLLISFSGAALGVLLAYKTVGVIVAMLPKFSFPHEAAIGVNLPVLVFSVGAALLTGVLFGLWPALRLSRPDVGQVMQSGSRKSCGAARRESNKQHTHRGANRTDFAHAGRGGRGDPGLSAYHEEAAGLRSAQCDVRGHPDS